jgi:DNA-binding protein H-NS
MAQIAIVEAFDGKPIDYMEKPATNNMKRKARRSKSGSYDLCIKRMNLNRRGWCGRGHRKKFIGRARSRHGQAQSRVLSRADARIDRAYGIVAR